MANISVFLTVVAVSACVLTVAVVCLVFLNKSVDRADQ